MGQPAAYGRSQARSWIRVAAAGHSQSHVRSESCLWYAAAHSNDKCLTPWVGPGIEPASSWIPVRFVTCRGWVTLGIPLELQFYVENLTFFSWSVSQKKKKKKRKSNYSIEGREGENVKGRNIILFWINVHSLHKLAIAFLVETVTPTFSTPQFKQRCLPCIEERLNFKKYILPGLCLESVWSSANPSPLKLRIFCVLKGLKFHSSRRSQFREAVICSVLPSFAVRWNHTPKDDSFSLPQVHSHACRNPITDLRQGTWLKVGAQTECCCSSSVKAVISPALWSQEGLLQTAHLIVGSKFSPHIQLRCPSCICLHP